MNPGSGTSQSGKRRSRRGQALFGHDDFWGTDILPALSFRRSYMFHFGFSSFFIFDIVLCAKESG